ncbi:MULTISPECIES: hypothetical protein [Paenibacillus]|uniref:hypothetical protein n=1 Tax=Paenibacillus TaxID=44249 RepID=UPI0022B8E9EE|nr:hypothetical protein [Paenibacillus caseinilyticus]MCZ8520533.1 hypothetical protein [Paenibacillus caseinilyticus]
MDKRKVITAYRRGFITMQECAQILGIDSPHILGLMNETDAKDKRALKHQPVSG